MLWSHHLRRSICPVVAGLAMMGSTSTSTRAADGPYGGVIHATSYASPSSIYAVHVIPDSVYGNGGATYHYSKQGTELWSDERPYTLREVVVTDQGLVTGFAYRVGTKRDEPKAKDGMRRLAGPVNPPQYLHIVILGADGSEILNDAIEREHPEYRMRPTPLFPDVRQFLVDSANDRIIVCLVGEGAVWRVYRLSTGEHMDMFDPMERAWNTRDLGFFVDLRLVAGTPLVLVHCCLTGPDYELKGFSARFALLDTEFNPVWSFDAAHDYTRLGFHRFLNRARIRRYFRDLPAILVSNSPGRFEVRLFAKNEEVSFSVIRTDSLGYEVTELGRVGIVIEEQICTDHLQSDR